MNRLLARVAVMLEQLLELQKTDMLLKRIEMRERRIAPLDNELQRRMGELEEQNVRRLEDELAEGREVIEDLEALLLERIGP